MGDGSGGRLRRVGIGPGGGAARGDGGTGQQGGAGLRRQAADRSDRAIGRGSAAGRLRTPRHRHAIDRLILTASGGPFRRWSLADMAEATPEQALAHPNWDMGAKISIDSATMMNKGLELI